MYLFQFPNVLSLSAKVRNLRREWTLCELQSILFFSFVLGPKAVSRISESQRQPLLFSRGMLCFSGTAHNQLCLQTARWAKWLSKFTL